MLPATPVELRSVELLPDGQTLVLVFADAEGAPVPLRLPVWGAQQLVRALERMRVIAPTPAPHMRP